MKKMKKMKKIMALALSFMMVVAMSVVSFAGEAGNTFTITAPATAHQYEIYQIFTGDLAEDGTTLSNVKWGVNGTGETGTAVAEDVITALTAVNSKTDAEKLDVIKGYATLSNPVATISNGATYSAVAGYYLIKDKDNTVSGTDEYTLYIVKVVGSFTIEPKSEVPSFEKKLKDINDSTENEYSEWQDSADYDIGDEVPFKLEGTVSGKYSEYKQYYFAFHDEQETGLTFNPESVKVYADNVDITGKGYTINTAPTDGCTFEIVFADLKKAAADNNFTVGNGTKIRVEYTATLNDDAVLGSHGNVNKGKLEFSNNPNQEQGGTPETGETPWDNVIVFTYKVVINKVDSENHPLAGAEFTLTKKLKNGESKVITSIKSEAGTTFTFKGLDDGEYTLTETKTPDKYNTISPITFTVNADHTITWNGENRDTVLKELTGTKVTGEITFTESVTDGSLSADVVNNKGSELPTTGGMGTTIFYVVGSILVLGAAILLITKKRMNAR